MDNKCFYNSADTEEKRDFYDRTFHFHKSKCNVNLDSALNELGMLSTITNSRLDYLKDQVKAQVKKKRSSNSVSSVPLCVVQMNSDFVTKFSLSKNSASITDCELSDESAKTNLRFKEKIKVKKIYKPYDTVSRPMRFSKKHERLECNYDAHVEDRASPPIVTRQDSGNKSNPSSPVKSQIPIAEIYNRFVGCSIFRSRSLDDLEFSKLNLNEECRDVGSRGEIDTVSQRISQLHVS